MWRALLLLVSLLSFLPLLAGDATAQPPANLDRVRSVAFLNASTGLITYTDLPQSTYRFTKDSTRLIPGLNGAQSLAVQDEDVAWCTIDRGLYRGDRAWTRWTLIDTEQAHLLVGCANGQLFFMSNGSLFSATASGVTADTGLLANDAIVQIDYQSSRVIYGLGGYGIYRSTDGGHDWSLFYPTSARGLYVDRVHHRIYVGGPLRVSTDDGTSWTQIPTELDYPFIPLYGTLSGAHDCTGAFYIAPYGNTTDAYRFGEDGFFHNAGPVLLSQWPHPGQTELPGSLHVFDGGAIAYSLPDRYATFVGIGGDLTDSARPQIIANVAPLLVDLCSATHDSIHVSIASRTCLPISIDSIRTTKSTGSVTTITTARVIAGSSVTIAASYTPRAPGEDTITLRVFLHNVEGRGYREWVDVTSIATVTGAAPLLGLSSSVDFGSVPVDSTAQRTIALRNLGCLSMTVDSVVSSHPSLFAVQSRTFPILVPHRDSLTFVITYHPTTSGEDLESVEIGTNAGHRFLTVTGRAIGKQDVARDDSVTAAPHIQLTDGALMVSSYTAGGLDLYTLLGQLVGSWSLSGGNAKVRCELPRGSLASGVYFLRLNLKGSRGPRTLRLFVP